MRSPGEPALDGDKPVYDQARVYSGLSAGYRFSLFRDKVRTKLQLTIQDLLEIGRLQAIAVNPDGKPYAFRSVDPRRFVLTASFDL